MRSLIRPLSIYIPANSRSIEHSVSGSYLWCRSSTATSDVIVYIDDDSYLPMHAGRSYRDRSGKGFTKIVVQNITAAPVTVIFDIGEAEVDDAALIVLNEIRVNETANALETPAALVLAAGNLFTGSVTPVAGTIRTVIAQNNGVNEVWWGAAAADIDPAAKRGIRILPNQTDVIPLSATIFFKSLADTTVSFNYLKVV